MGLLDFSELAPLLERAGVEVEPSTQRMRRYCELLLQWNRKVANLISNNDEPRLVSRHLRESLEPAHWLKQAVLGRWMDFGSGGGLPGIPLVLAGVGERWTLVESRRSKALFLRRACEELGLRTVSVEQARLEDIMMDEQDRGAYDGFVSRATLPLGPTLALAAVVVRAGGAAYLWKGSRRDEEKAEDQAWRDAWSPDGELALADGQTVVLRFLRK